MCLSGDGKGRIQFFSNKNRFSYETLLESSKELWSLFVSIPFHGDEVLYVGYDAVDASKLKVSGSIYTSTVEEIKKQKHSKHYLTLLNEFLYKFSLYLKSYTMHDLNYKQLFKGGHCAGKKIDGQIFTGECSRYLWKYDPDSFELFFKADGGNDFFLRFNSKDPSVGYYNHMKVSLEHSGENIVSMEFFLSECATP